MLQVSHHLVFVLGTQIHSATVSLQPFHYLVGALIWRKHRVKDLHNLAIFNGQRQSLK